MFGIEGYYGNMETSLWDSSVRSNVSGKSERGIARKFIKSMIRKPAPGMEINAHDLTSCKDDFGKKTLRFQKVL